MPDRWQCTSPPSSNYSSPAVVLDQCVSSTRLAKKLAEQGVYVARAMCGGSIDDMEIAGYAEDIDALLITKDRGMRRISRRSLILTSGMRMDDDGVAIIVWDASFVLGLETSIWPHHPRSYVSKLEILRDTIYAIGHIDPQDERNGRDGGVYSHNDPRYITSLNRRLHKLDAAAYGDEKSPASSRLRDIDKQVRELGRHAHNSGYKRGVGYPVAV